jgi:hypothetical protein
MSSGTNQTKSIGYKAHNQGKSMVRKPITNVTFLPPDKDSFEPLTVQSRTNGTNTVQFSRTSFNLDNPEVPENIRRGYPGIEFGFSCKSENGYCDPDPMESEIEWLEIGDKAIRVEWTVKPSNLAVGTELDPSPIDQSFKAKVTSPKPWQLKCTHTNKLYFVSPPQIARCDDICMNLQSKPPDIVLCDPKIKWRDDPVSRRSQEDSHGSGSNSEDECKSGEEGLPEQDNEKSEGC